MLAFILAGGRGKRMDVLCYNRPKPALTFAGKYRVIDFSLSNCFHSGIGSVAILTDYQRSSITNYLNNWNNSNKVFENFDLLEPRSGSYRGTADAVYQNLDYLRQYPGDLVIVLAGDHVYKMDYRSMIAYHRQVKADATVGVIPIPLDQAHRFGILTTNSKGRIENFVEKPTIPESNLASMGIYIFNKEVLIERLMEDAVRPDSPHDFGYAVIPGMIRRDRVFAYSFNGYWRDIGTKEAYYSANMELVSPSPAFSLNGTWPVCTGEQAVLPARKFERGVIKNSIISPGCVIKGYVENCIISPGVWIEEQAEVRNSVLMANTFIGYHSMINRCILDEDVNISKYCYIGFGASAGQEDITVLGEDVSVPSHTAVGRNCRILPHIHPADFATSMVPSGTTLSPRKMPQHLRREQALVKGTKALIS